MKIAIYGNNYQDSHLKAVAAFITGLAARGVSVEIERSFRSYLGTSLHPGAAVAVGPEPPCADLALSIGGDGTFLRTAQWVADTGTPILGINTGHLGYLAAVHIDDAMAMIDDTIAGRCAIERRALLKLQVEGRDTGRWPYALNEVAVLKDDTSSMITVKARVNGHDLATYLADGLIVATPTGSTGYNLSVGGPIVEPTAPNWVISPIAAHSLTMRPLVISSSSVIELITTSRAASFRVSIDGRSITLPRGTALTLRRAPFTTAVVQRQGHTFAATLRHKLLWGLDPR